MATMYRQGDVLIVKVSSIPKGLKEIAREGGKIVLAHGEATGHSHAIDMPSAKFVINEQTRERYLTLDKVGFLRHEEHAEIKLPAGKYKVIQQVEYTGRDYRAVVD